MKMVKEPEEKSYEERLRALGLFSLEETEGRPQCSYSFIERGREGQTLISALW